MNRYSWFADLVYSARHPVARAGVWACAVGIVLLIVAVAFWWPAQRAYDQLNADIATKRRELVQVQQAEELTRMYARAQKEIPALEKKLEQAVSQAQLVQGLGRLARQRGVQIVSESYQEAKGAGGQMSLIAELTVQGGYAALRDFLHDLPSLPTWSEIQEVRLEAGRGSGDIKGRIRVVTYRRTPTTDARS